MKYWVGFLLCLCLLFCFAAIAEDTGWIEISDAEGLAAIQNNPDGKYRLTRDIDLAGIDWTPVALNGEFDGAGHAILNLTVTKTGPNEFTTVDGNKKTYKTRGAALFDRVMDAYIHDVSLIGVYVDVETSDNCFCAALISGASYATVDNVTISGRVRLRSSAKMVGVGGVSGFMRGPISNSKVNVELVFVDTNPQLDCEEFAGAMIACGHGDLVNDDVTTSIYASVHGYCHNGGMVGMYTKGLMYRATMLIKNCIVGCTINFFEDVEDRRAYARVAVGEALNSGITYEDNLQRDFQVYESKDFNTELYPCKCGVEPTRTVTPPTADTYGCTLFVCPSCNYSYSAEYTLKLET